MKLIDLNPRFTNENSEKVLVFDCPKPANEHYDHAHSFRIPVGGSRGWNIDTDDFNLLTLRPSVADVTSGYPGEKAYCGIHFYITKGEIEIL